jgi:hypothetical protein
MTVGETVAATGLSRFVEYRLSDPRIARLLAMADEVLAGAVAGFGCLRKFIWANQLTLTAIMPLAKLPGSQCDAFAESGFGEGRVSTPQPNQLLARLDEFERDLIRAHVGDGEGEMGRAAVRKGRPPSSPRGSSSPRGRRRKWRIFPSVGPLDQAGVPVRKKTVAAGDGVRIGGLDPMEPGESGDQHQECRTGQVKIG